MALLIAKYNNNNNMLTCFLSANNIETNFDDIQLTSRCIHSILWMKHNESISQLSNYI